MCFYTDCRSTLNAPAPPLFSARGDVSNALMFSRLHCSSYCGFLPSCMIIMNPVMGSNVQKLNFFLNVILFCYSLQDFYKFYEVTGLKWKVSNFTFKICDCYSVYFVPFGCFNVDVLFVFFRHDVVENIGLMTFLTRPSSFSKASSLFLFLCRFNYLSL